MVEELPLCVQFTELQQKEQLAKLAMARESLATAPATRKFKFVSALNEQVGFPSLKMLSKSPKEFCSCLPHWRLLNLP